MSIDNSIDTKEEKSTRRNFFRTLGTLVAEGVAVSTGVNKIIDLSDNPTDEQGVLFPGTEKFTVTTQFGDHVLYISVLDRPPGGIVAGEISYVSEAWKKSLIPREDNDPLPKIGQENVSAENLILGFAGIGTSRKKQVVHQYILEKLLRRGDTIIEADTVPMAMFEKRQIWQQTLAVTYFAQVTAAYYVGLSGLDTLISKFKRSQSASRREALPELVTRSKGPQSASRRTMLKVFATGILALTTAATFGKHMREASIEPTTSNVLSTKLGMIAEDLVFAGIPDREVRIFVETLTHMRSLNMLRNTQIGALILQENADRVFEKKDNIPMLFSAGNGHADAHLYSRESIDQQDERMRLYARNIITCYLPALFEASIRDDYDKFFDAYDSLTYLAFLGFGVPRLKGYTVAEKFRDFSATDNLPKTAFLIFLEELDKELGNKQADYSEFEDFLKIIITNNLMANFISAYMPFQQEKIEGGNQERVVTVLYGGTTADFHQLRLLPDPTEGLTREEIVVKIIPFSNFSGSEENNKEFMRKFEKVWPGPIYYGYINQGGVPIPILVELHDDELFFKLGRLEGNKFEEVSYPFNT